MADAEPTGPLLSGGAIREAGTLHAPPVVAAGGETARCLVRGGLVAAEGAEAVVGVVGAAGVAAAVAAVGVEEAGGVVAGVGAEAEVDTGGGRPR
jgi:hypothetical protein